MTESLTIIERINKFNEPLLQDKVKLKYKLMSKNEYTFYRGTCHIFYEDLAKVTLPDSPLSWICGDLHLENFGSYKSDNRQVYFDMNDFDEAILAPAAWELVRIVTSIFISFSALKINKEEALLVAEIYVKHYSKILSKGKSHYSDSRTAEGIVRKFLNSVRKRKQKELLKSHAEKRKGDLVLLIDGKKLEKLENGLKLELIDHFNKWIKSNNECPYDYEAIDIAFRIAGTGSLGVKRYLALCRGTKDPKSYLLLDMKEERPSSVAPYITIPQPDWPSHAHRVVEIQDRVQNVSPALFSTSHFRGESYVMQEMQPMEDRIDFNSIKDDHKDLIKVIEDMAMLNASGQLRSCGRNGSSIADDMIAFGKREDWQTEIINYAVNYSELVKKDFKQFAKEYKQSL